MKRKRWIIIAGILAGAILLTAGLVVWAQASSSGNKRTATPMTIETVGSLKSSQRQLISGSVHPAESENFYVEQAKGRINEIKVAQGAQVRKGEELYTYSNPTLTINYEKMQIQRDTAAKKERTLQTNLANINRDIRRAPTTEAADQLKAQRDEIRAQIDATKTEIRLAQLDIEQASEEIAALTVRSNFDGIVEVVNEAERNAVAQGAATKPLLRLVSNLPYEIKGTLTELQRAQIKQDQRFIATSRALPNQKWQGVITYVSTFPSESANTQGSDYSQVQYEFIAKLDGQENLVPGNTLFLEVAEADTNTFTVPTAAVRRDDPAAPHIFVVENNVLRKQVVTTGPDVDGRTTITTPLDDSTQILLNPDATTAEGMEVIR